MFRLAVLLFVGAFSLGSEDRVLVRVPSTGEAPAQAIVERSDHSLVLVKAAAGKEFQEIARLGKRVVLDQQLKSMIPQGRFATNVQSIAVSGGKVYAIATTGLASSPGSIDSYTGRRLYLRQDNLMFLGQVGQTFTNLLKRQYDEIDDIKLVRFSTDLLPFFAIQTHEGQKNSLIHVFRVTANNRVLPVDIPEPDVDGKYQETVVGNNDGTNTIVISVRQPGTFANAPGKKWRELKEVCRWDDKKHRFAVVSQSEEYS